MINITKVIAIIFHLSCSVFLLMSFSYSEEIIGEKLFNRNCAACHKKAAPNLNGTTLGYNVFKNIVLNGRGGTMMGSFKSKFDDQDIENIYNYLKVN